MIEILRRSPVLHLGGGKTVDLGNIRPPAKSLSLSAEGAAMNGEPDGAPIVPSFPLADMASGLYAANALMFALYDRDVHGGTGQVIDVALFESLFSLLGPLAAEYAAMGRLRGREGRRRCLHRAINQSRHALARRPDGIEPRGIVG